MITALKKQFPKGFAWRLPAGFLTDLIGGLAIEPGRIKEFLRGVVTESNPGTAVDTQQEWYQQYGIPFEPTKTIIDQQAETLERYVALGDQDIVYLQDQVDKAGFVEVTIFETAPPIGDESNECGIAECGIAECWDVPSYITDQVNWIFYYLVKGTVDTDDDLDRLVALLQRLAPGHCIPIFQITISNNVSGPAECGVAFCDG